MVGVLLLTTVEDTLPQGDEPAPPRMVSTTSFAGGFVVFAVISALLK
jgi:ZIP family zinc transporter